MEARVGLSNKAAAGGGKISYINHTTNLKQEEAAVPSKLGTVPHLVAGGLAGAFSKTCTAPFARLTILFQVLSLISFYGVLLTLISFHFMDSRRTCQNLILYRKWYLISFHFIFHFMCSRFY